MPAGAIGAVWAEGSWEDTAWEADAWGESSVQPIEGPINRVYVTGNIGGDVTVTGEI